MPGIDRETAYLIRDILALPEKERIKVFEKLREDLSEAAAPSAIDELNVKMKNAIETFNKVAEHLGYDHDLLKLQMKMREFDSVPSRHRDGVKARQIAGVFFGSWPLAKRAATGGSLEPSPRQAKLREELVRQRRRVERMSAGIYEFLDSEPEQTGSNAYDRWRKERNKELPADSRPLASAGHIVNTYRRKWDQLFEEAQKGSLSPPGNGVGTAQSEQPESGSGEEQAGSGAKTDPAAYVFDLELVARRIRAELDRRGWTPRDLQLHHEISEVTVRNIEDGQRGQNIHFSTIVRIASALEIPIEHFVTSDGQQGPPPKRPRKRAYKRRKRSKRG